MSTAKATPGECAMVVFEVVLVRLFGLSLRHHAETSEIDAQEAGYLRL